MFLLRPQRTIRYNMRPRPQPQPVTRIVLQVLALLVSLLLAWKTFAWIAL